MTPKGLIFNIQKFSLHDGPGIRTTVFFKGCPLNCPWCHNPESWSPRPEALLREDLCGGCGSCVKHCPQGAVVIEEGRALTRRELCAACGRCVRFCPANGRSLCGREVGVDELMAEVKKDEVFYRRSGGGLTCSGGEALVQIDFLQALLQACRASGIHTAVDTSGFAPAEHFERILPLTDLFLYDLKHMDEAAHLQLMGCSNGPILANLRLLARAGARIWVRVPLVPGLNDGDENILRTIEFLKDIRPEQVSLLPFHQLGRRKAAQLGQTFSLEGVEAPDASAVEGIRRRFEEAGLKAITGG